MNVFKRSKKPKDKENVDPFGQMAASEPASSKMSRSLKRKNKGAPEPKPEFDLAAALPNTNDFRTSLLMPGLSARFSMLKEQDDPNSLLGKASDDSVLFPKRASRMNVFGNNPLADIAETESLHSIPKPFARDERTMSMSEGGYASDDGGSVMSRSRPGEGNNLFGGRQKVYRLATGGGSGSGSGSGQGRHLYDDDINLSPYQQWRAAKSREDVAKPDVEYPSESVPRDSEEADQVQSPITAFSKNRGTTSSTTSGPSNRRTSTAATSVATCESPIPRQNSGHGPASKMRSSDGYESNNVSRNPSSNSRKDFPLKENVAQPPMPSASPLGHRLSQSRSAVNLKERYGAPSPVFSSNAYRANSPPPAQGMPPLHGGIQESSKLTHMQSRRYQTASPTHQNFDDDGNVYSNNIHANDRGKATAMGLFNRPRQQYDEQQFLQRQRQMHEGRISPPKSDTPERMVSPDAKSSATGPPENHLSTTSDEQPSQRDDQEAQQSNDAHPAPSRGTRKVVSPIKTDDRDNIMPKSISAPNKPGVGNVKARVESLIRRQNAELNALEGVRQPLSPPQGERVVSQGSQSSNKMPPSPFLNRFDSSDDETEEAQPPPARQSRPKIAPDEVHPALRNGTHDFDFGEQVSPRAPNRHSEEVENTPSLHINPDAGPASPQKPFEDDSPTLGPNGLGLSGMIRTHLRHDSDRSSFYPHSPTTSNFHRSRTSREMSMVSTSNTINPPDSVHSDPWEFDNAQRNQHVSPRKDSEPSAPAALTMSQKAQQILGHAATQRAQAGPSSKAQRILGNEAPNSSAESILSPRWPPNSKFDANSSNETVESRPWQEDQYGHHRNASTDTQKEQQDFDAELAERRRRIQEGLKGISEQERVMSPGPGRRSNEQHNQTGPGLRHKASKGAMGGGEYSNKAMKMLGLNGAQPPPEHHRPPPRHYNSSDNEYDEPPRERQWGRGPGNRPPPAPSQGYNVSGRRTPHEGYANGRRTPADGRTTPYGNSSNEDFERARQRSATPNSSRGYGRDRAGSEAAERSKSRTRHYRDDEGYGPSPQLRQGSSPSPPQGERRRSPEESRRMPGYERSPSAMSGGRARSNSRPGPPPQGYFDARGAPPTPAMNGPGPTVGASPVREREPMAPHPMYSGPGVASPAIGAPRPSPRPPQVVGLPASPMPSPFPVSPAFPQASSSTQPTNGRTTPSVDSGRTTPGGNRRRMTVNKNMISEPTLVSSTSSIPLVGLPNGHHVPPANNSTPNLGRSETPPLPAMNPRRRGGGADSPAPASLVAPPMAAYGGSHSAQPSPSFGMPAHFAPSSALDPGFGPPSPAPQGPPPRARNRLRKTSSEGGNLASKARQQALAAELRGEQSRTPTVAAFQFQQGGFARSQTSLGMSERDGGMF